MATVFNLISQLISRKLDVPAEAQDKIYASLFSPFSTLRPPLPTFSIRIKKTVRSVSTPSQLSPQGTASSAQKSDKSWLAKSWDPLGFVKT